MSGGPGGDVVSQKPLNVPLALTTTFTPPASCLAPTFTLHGRWNDTLNSTVLGSLTNYDLTRGYRPECFPTKFDSVIASSNHYSPGLCPESYSTGQFSLSATSITVVTCCPTLSGTSSLSGTDCSGFLENATIISGDATSVIPFVSRFVATAVVVQSDASDSSILDTTSTASPSPSSSLPSPTASPTATTSPTPSSSSAPSSGALSTAAKIGIGIGVSIFVIAHIPLGWFLWRRWRKQPRAKEEHPDKPELDGEGKQHSDAQPRVELDVEGNLHEAAGANKPGELGCGDMPAELDGEWRGWEAPAKERKDILGEEGR